MIFSRKKPKTERLEKPAVKASQGPTEQTAAVKSEKLKVPAGSGAITRLIRQPMLTEKSAGMEAENKYVFVVHKKANKAEIKKEVEQLFNVKVMDVNIINKRRKQRMWRGKIGFTPSAKKAIVTIEEGKKLEILPT